MGTPHWHPDTYELNFILEGKLTYWIFTYGAPGVVVPPQQGFVPQGSALVSPLGLMHLLYNDECDILSMMHSFPTSTNEDFFSAWANTQGMPEAYLNNAMPQSPGGASMIKELNIPDGVQTLSQQSMQRCGITQQYYDQFKCPAELPSRRMSLSRSHRNPLFESSELEMRRRRCGTEQKLLQRTIQLHPGICNPRRTVHAREHLLRSLQLTGRRHMCI